MRYKIKGGKVVDIPDDQINKSMALLGLTRSEAVQMWLEDEGYEVNEEQEALEKKAKENRITAKIHQAKATDKPKTQRERVVKEDKVKEDIVKAIAEMLPSLNAENVVIEKKGKLITFEVGADKFKLDLIRQRPPKESKG
jgi:hypothetical protein